MTSGRNGKQLKENACHKSFLHAPRIRNASIIVDLFAGVIRAFIITQKLKGLVVEVPDIMKLLKDVSSLSA